MTAPDGRHDGTGLPFDAARDPGCIRAAWVAEHDLRHLPERIRRHRQDEGGDVIAYLQEKGEVSA